jgi:hypothetical protein
MAATGRRMCGEGLGGGGARCRCGQWRLGLGGTGGRGNDRPSGGSGPSWGLAGG